MFNGRSYNLADATRDWRPIYHRVQKQANNIGDYSYKSSSKTAKHFDAMTIPEWVQQYVPGGSRGALGQLIQNAFTEENALDPDRQSALNVIQTLAEDPRNNFNLYYTESDQRFHIRGGNDQIATILANRSFKLAVDFSMAGFRPLKVQAINTLPIGVSCKTQLQFTRRAWYDVGCNSEIRLPAVAFDTTWDVTRSQPGAFGILNFFAGGTQALQAGEIGSRALARLLMQEAEPLIPGLASLWNGLMIKNAWQFDPWSFGSYSTYQPGYQTTVLGIKREPERNCFFAGEHTADQNGFLNSAVETGQRAARQVAASLV